MQWKKNLIFTNDIILRFSLLKIGDIYAHFFSAKNDNMLILGIGIQEQNFIILLSQNKVAAIWFYIITYKNCFRSLVLLKY